MTVSENPARVAGLDHIGSLTPGKRADVLLFGPELTLLHTMVNGKLVYSRPL